MAYQTNKNKTLKNPTVNNNDLLDPSGRFYLLFAETHVHLPDDVPVQVRVLRCQVFQGQAQRLVVL